MPRYAAVDIGSNSVRMMAADVLPSGETKILATDRQITRLGESVFRNGRISDEAMTTLRTVLARMAGTYQKLDVFAIRAVATAAVRDASNQDEFIEAMSQVLGISVEIISGQEEARLIHLGVTSRWPHPSQRVLMVDVGGGSAELILSDNNELTEAVSKPLGAVRLTETLLTTDPPSEADLQRLELYIAERLDGVPELFSGQQCTKVIGTSSSAAATVCAVNRIPRPERDSADRLRATLPQVRQLYQEISRLDLAGRKKFVGIGPRRAEIIVPGMALFRQVLERFQVPALYYSTAGVRDGIIADLANRGVGLEKARLDRAQRRVVEEMARRYGVPLKHARKVAAFAHTLFTALRPLHKLPVPYGKLLEAAAYLHDAGHYISDTGHHKHSFYIVSNADLPGFTALERRILALLCRYHRKTLPTPRHEAFQMLDPASRNAVMKMTPLLRLADALDQGHGQRIEKIRVEPLDREVCVAVETESDPNLELWAADRVRPAFQQVYEKALTLQR